MVESPHAEIEVLTWAVSLINKIKKEKKIKSIKSKIYKGKSQITKILNVKKSKFVNTKTYSRKDLLPGNIIRGACVLVEDQTTIIVSDNFQTKVLSNNYLEIEMIKENKMSKINEITNQLMWNRLLSVVEEQGQTLVRTAFSPIVRECGDISAGIFDLKGRMMAQAVTGTLDM